MTATVDLLRQYTRDDPRGRFPRRTGAPPIECNRLAMVWRPLIDMTHLAAAPISLRMIAPVSAAVVAAEPGRISWFSRMSVPGLRSQVVRHAGLDRYDAAAPAGLPPGLRTPAWQHLVEAVDAFPALDGYTRALVVFQLAQLTLNRFALTLTGGLVAPRGERGADQYAYETARLAARLPGRVPAALPVFEALATGPDPVLAYHACFQGIAHALRGTGDLARAERFAAVAGTLPPLGDTWEAHLTHSRFHRALVRLNAARGCDAQVRAELDAAWRRQDAMDARAPAGDEDVVLLSEENRRDLIELEIESARTGPPADPERLRGFAAELLRLDPRAVEALLFVGDAHLLAGDHAGAARWYARAGELGTSAGAIGWFRAGQCYDLIGDTDAAVAAMGRCLELDTAAVEPRHYLAERG